MSCDTFGVYPQTVLAQKDFIEIAKNSKSASLEIADLSEEIKNKALNACNVIKHIEGKEIVKVIVIPNKIVNIVAK